VQVSGGRSSERDGMEGSAIDIVGRSNENGAMLGAKSSLRREGGAVTDGRELMTSLAAVAGEGMDVAVGEAMQWRGSKKALRSASAYLMVRAARKANVDICDLLCGQ